MNGEPVLCYADQWTPVYQSASLGSLVITNLANASIQVRWRVFTASLPLYMQGFAGLGPGEQKTIVFGLPTPYARFEINVPVDAWFAAK